MAQANDAELRITASLDDKVTAAVQSLASELKSMSEAAKKAFDDANKAAKAAGIEVTDLADTATTAATDLAGAGAAAKAAFDNVAAGAETAGDSLSDTGKKAKDTTDKLNETGKKGKEAGDAVKAGFGEALVGAVSFSAVISAIVADLRNLYSEARKLEEIQARLSLEFDSSAASVAEVSKQIELLVDDFKFQVKESDLLAIALSSIQDGLTEAGNAANFAGSAFILSRSANISLTDAYQTLADATRTFGLEAEASYDTANQLFLASKIGATNFKAFQLAIAQLGPQARQLGVSLSDTAAAVATLTKTAGFEGTKAVSALDRVLDTLTKRQKDIEPQLAKTGYTLADVNVESLGLAVALDNLRSAYKGNDQGLRDLLGSTDAYNAILGLTGENLAKAAKNQDKLALGGGQLLTAFQKLQSTVGAVDLTFQFATTPVSAFTDLVGALDNVGEGLSNYGDQTREASKKALEGRAALIEQQRAAQALAYELRKTRQEVDLGAASFENAAPALLEFRDKLKGIADPTIDADLQKIYEAEKALVKQLDELTKTTPITPAQYKAALDEIKSATERQIEDLQSARESAEAEAMAQFDFDQAAKLRKERETADASLKIEGEKNKRIVEQRLRLIDAAQSAQVRADQAIAQFAASLSPVVERPIELIKVKTDELISKIDQAREARSRLGELTPADLQYFDALTARVRELGAAAAEELRDEQAKRISAFTAKSIADIQGLALDSLDPVVAAFARIGEEAKLAGTTGREAFLKQAEEAGVAANEALALADALAVVKERAAEIQQTEILLKASLQVDTGEEDILAGIRARIEPLAGELNDLLVVRGERILSNEDVADIDARIKQIKESARSIAEEGLRTGEAFEAGFTGAITRAIDTATNKFQQGAQLGKAAFDSLGSSIATLFDDLILGSKSATDAFKDFVRNFIQGIVQAINQLIAFEIASRILKTLGFVSGGATAAAAPAGGATIFADGGVMPGQMSKPTYFAEGGIMEGTMSDPIVHEDFKPAKVKKPRMFAEGGVMAGTMMAAATGLPMRAYANGGVTNEPQVAVFGEGPGAEAFVPLPGPNRGIPVEFQNTPSSMVPGSQMQAPEAPQVNITVAYNPNINALDGRSTKEVLLREARVIGDIVAAEIATGANRGLTDVVRGRSTNA